MADVSDSRIEEAYQKVRGKDGDDWLLLGYQDNKKIVLVETGTGGVNGLASHLKDDGCFYAYVRVTLNQDETTRTKFALITFKGDGAPVMRKGNMSVHINSVKTKIKDANVALNFSELSEVTEDAVLSKLKAANY